MRYPTLCVLAERKCAHRGVGAYYGGAPSALSATRAPVQCKSSDGDPDLRPFRHRARSSTRVTLTPRRQQKYLRHPLIPRLLHALQCTGAAYRCHSPTHSMTNRRSFPAILRGLVLDICVGLWTWVSSTSRHLETHGTETLRGSQDCGGSCSGRSIGVPTSSPDYAIFIRT